VAADPGDAGLAELDRDGGVLEVVPDDLVVDDASVVGLGPGGLEQIAVVVPPQVDGALVAPEDVVADDIAGAVLDVDAAALEAVGALTVALEEVAGDESVLRVAAPDAADGVLHHAIPDEAVAEAEGELDAVGGGVGE